MSVMAAPRRATPAAEPEDSTPGFWCCPRCPYRIADDFPCAPGEDPISEHRAAHRLTDMGKPPNPRPGKMRPELRR